MTERGRRPTRRVVAAGLGIALLLAVGLYPTFGGLILRAGFATGGMGFLTGQGLGAANALGAAASALAYGAALGLGTVLAAGLRPGSGRRARRIAARAGRAAASFLTLWWAMAVLATGRGAGLAGWPRAPLDAREALLAAALVAAAFLPHAFLCLAASARSPRPG